MHRRTRLGFEENTNLSGISIAIYMTFKNQLIERGHSRLHDQFLIFCTLVKNRRKYFEFSILSALVTNGKESIFEIEEYLQLRSYETAAYHVYEEK